MGLVKKAPQSLFGHLVKVPMVVVDKLSLAVDELGNHTKAHGIRPNWLSGIRHTVRLDLGTIQNRDVGIRHKKLCYC